MPQSPIFQNPITINGTLYVASDFHLGTPDESSSRKRETLIVKWLDQISHNATHLILLGDIFDFWFEYKYVVPKGYFRFLAKLDQLRNQGVEIYYFTGNHDLWVKDYFTQELGITIFRKQQPFVVNGKRCLIGHGDGLGKGEKGYKLMKKGFSFKPNIVLYRALHPYFAFGLARFLSRKSRAATAQTEEQYLGDDKELLVLYAQSVLKDEEIDYFIYAHRHLPIEKIFENGSAYFNTGDWLTHNSYLRFDEKTVELLTMKE